ncbi:hypothetical protein [Streptomyces sp. NPDC059816]|uniref:hypothetical protein n=1 Tax=Streptomyces sp. NPDC059816 TaxID=3346960 RepID=UPI00365DDD4E
MAQGTGEADGAGAGEGARFVRLLPWSTEEGKPCFLVSDEGGAAGDGRGGLRRIADEMERTQLGQAVTLLERAGCLVADERSGERELRFVVEQLCTSLREVSRVAESRGARLAAVRDLSAG